MTYYNYICNNYYNDYYVWLDYYVYWYNQVTTEGERFVSDAHTIMSLSSVE